MTLNSSKSIIPSPSRSTPLIIFRHSSMVQSSPRLRITFWSSSAEMEPFLSMSKTEKASLRLRKTSSESTSLVLSSMNSWRSMNPSPSASTSLIMSLSSSSVTTWPRLPMMDPSSDEEILPSPLMSNFLNTCPSSSSMRARELNDDVLEFMDPPFSLAALSARFFLLNRDLNPIMSTNLVYHQIFLGFFLLEDGDRWKEESGNSLEFLIGILEWRWKELKIEECGRKAVETYV